MKRLTHLLATCVLISALTIVIASCQKVTPQKTTTQSHAGTWAFKGVTYNSDSCALAGFIIGSYLSANSTADRGTHIVCTFDSSEAFTANGTFIVQAPNYTYAPGFMDKGHVSVVLNVVSGNSQTEYYASPGQVVSATRSNGKLTVSSSLLMMINFADHSDSAAMSMSIADSI